MRARAWALDGLRAGAAFLVLVGHVRAFLFVDWNATSRHGPISALFYFLTGLGHEAVIVFFVLSGFFVGGSVLAAFRQDRWNTLDYAVRRLTRLYVVLVPALVLTWGLDSLGSAWLGGAGYDGRFGEMVHSGPGPGSPADYSIPTWIGNLTFLASLRTPVLGSNGPLWSLSFEFWYYVLFPALMLAIFSRGGQRAISLGVGAVLLAFLPIRVLEGGLVWLLGVGAWWLADRLGGLLEAGRLLAARLACTVVFCAALVALRRADSAEADLVLGIASAPLVVVLSLTQAKGSSRTAGWARLEQLAARASDGSYTLYLTHFPLLAYCAYLWILPGRFQPDSAQGILLFCAFSGGAIAYAAILWWLFERNTDRWRRHLRTWLDRQFWMRTFSLTGANSSNGVVDRAATLESVQDSRVGTPPVTLPTTERD